MPSEVTTLKEFFNLNQFFQILAKIMIILNLIKHDEPQNRVFFNCNISMKIFTPSNEVVKIYWFSHPHLWESVVTSKIDSIHCITICSVGFTYNFIIAHKQI